MISIALLGENRMAEQLESILRQYSEFYFMGQFEFRELIQESKKPNLILFFVICGRESQLEQIKVLKAKSKIYVSSSHCNEDFVREVLKAGVHAYLWEDELLENLPEVLRAIDTGKHVFSESIIESLYGLR